MLQMHSVETEFECGAVADAEPQTANVNVVAWQLMGDVLELLQGDVERHETVRRLRAVLGQLLPVLQEIRDHQFETGVLSDLLHASADTADVADERLQAFGRLIETLDELAIRLEWNLPVAEVVPFADLRLARWMAEASASGRVGRFSGE